MDTSTLLLHERLLLLVLDGQKGTSRSRYAAPALAGAVLVDLLHIGAIAQVRGGIAVSGTAAAPAGVLGDAAKVIADEPKPRVPQWWVNKLPWRMRPFRPRLAGRLIENGVLTQDRHKVLGLFATTRLPGRARAPEAEVRERLRAVLIGDIQPDTQDAILAGLLAELNLVGTVVDKDQRKQARRRAQELRHDVREMGDEVGQVIKAAQDAVDDRRSGSGVARRD